MHRTDTHECESETVKCEQREDLNTHKDTYDGNNYHDCYCVFYMRVSIIQLETMRLH